MAGNYTVEHMTPIGNGNFVTPYWGTSALNAFPTEVADLVSLCTRYVDLTAGGGGMVFHQARLGQRAHGNDRNPYSALGFMSFGDAQARTVNHAPHAIVEEFAERWHPTNVPTSVGFAYAAQTGTFSAPARRWAPRLHSSTAAYIDSICMTGTEAARYLIGRVMMSTFTLRGYGWCGKAAEGCASDEVSPTQIWEKLVREAYRLLTAATRARGKVTGSMLSAEGAALDSNVVTDGSFVYMDPTWPWGPSSDPVREAMTFLTEQLGTLLLQRRQVVTDDELSALTDKTRIANDVTTWIGNALRTGARYACVGMQTTNYSIVPGQLYSMIRHPSRSTHQRYQEVMVTKKTHHSYDGSALEAWYGIYERR